MMGLLLVMAAYTGFYIPPGVAPARVALGFLCFMMVLNNINATVNKLPPMLAKDRVWMIDFMLALMVLNFSALVEFGMVTYALECDKKLTALIEAQQKKAEPPKKAAAPQPKLAPPSRSAKVGPMSAPPGPPPTKPPPGPPNAPRPGPPAALRPAPGPLLGAPPVGRPTLGPIGGVQPPAEQTLPQQPLAPIGGQPLAPIGGPTP